MLDKNLLEICTNEIKKHGESENLSLKRFDKVLTCLMSIMEIIDGEEPKELEIILSSDNYIEESIRYYQSFEVFDNDGHYVQEHENGYLKSIYIEPKTHDVFIEFSTYYMEISEDSLSPMLFLQCKKIGFTVQEDDKEKGCMTVGILIESPFAQ